MLDEVGDARPNIYDKYPHNPGKIMIRENVKWVAMFLQKPSCILLPVADIFPS
jgi:hypothetical protein